MIEGGSFEASQTGAALLHGAAETLREHAGRLAQAAAVLPADDFWWRPHPDGMAFGNIVAHLEGNVRQWILSGLGSACDHRDRTAEFDAQAGDDLELLASLGATVAEAVDHILALEPAGLGRSCSIQGFATTPLHAVLHVVEHFAWHTGQAVWIAKARAGQGHGLAFYDDASLDGLQNG